MIKWPIVLALVLTALLSSASAAPAGDRSCSTDATLHAAPVTLSIPQPAPTDDALYTSTPTIAVVQMSFTYTIPIDLVHQLALSPDEPMSITFTGEQPFVIYRCPFYLAPSVQHIPIVLR